MLKKGLFAGGADTGTVSGMMLSVDGEDYEIQYNTSEKDEISEHHPHQNKESFLSGQLSGAALGYIGVGEQAHLMLSSS